MIPNTLTTDEVMRATGAAGINEAEVALFGDILRGSDAARDWHEANVLVGTLNQSMSFTVVGQAISLDLGP